MSKEVLQLSPGRSLGNFTLELYLKDVLDRLKNNSQDSQPLNLTYSASDPSTSPLLVALPDNGLRLRFDGPEQRLRLIEVVDFSKALIKYNRHDVFKSTDTYPEGGASLQPGPTHRALTKLFGPTYPGEYVSTDVDGEPSQGHYVLSYPGLGFAFPYDPRKWPSDPEAISSLLASSARMATSMAIFEGRSWAEARNALYNPLKIRSRPKTAPQLDSTEPPDDVSLVKVLGEGRIEIVRRSGHSFWLTLSETTPQDLVSELGPPDAIYQKNDRRLAIHKKGKSAAQRNPSTQAVLDDDSDDDSPAMSPDARELVASEHFYNYFRLGLDILISQPTAASMPSPTVPEAKAFDSSRPACFARNHLTATKLLIHANVPGTWDFNRYHRCRWSLEHVPTAAEPWPLTSEVKFAGISARLREVFSSAYGSADEARAQQRGMSLNRGWGASPDSSIELLGGWEEEMPEGISADGNMLSDGLDSSSELFGFPGMIFEVLKDGIVSCLTVY